MANNRMWLVNSRSGERVLLAKYYPSGGWRVPDDGLTDALQSVFNKSDSFGPNPHGIGGGKIPLSSLGMYGGNEWQVEYEVEEQ